MEAFSALVLTNSFVAFTFLLLCMCSPQVGIPMIYTDLRKLLSSMATVISRSATSSGSVNDCSYPLKRSFPPINSAIRLNSLYMGSFSLYSLVLREGSEC